MRSHLFSHSLTKLSLRETLLKFGSFRTVRDRISDTGYCIHAVLCASSPDRPPPTGLIYIRQITYALSGHDLNVVVIFTSLQLFNVGSSII